MSRVLGASGIGDYNYTVGIVTYFGLIAATGTASFGNREIARRQNDVFERSKMFWEIWIFRLTCTGIALLAFVVFIFNFLPQYRILFLIQLFTVGSWIADISWFCQGMENFKVTALRNLFIKLFGTALVFLLVKKKEDLWIYTMIYSVTFLFGNLSMWGYAAKQIKLVNFKYLHPFGNTKDIFQLFIPVIAIQIYTVLDKTMLGTFGNTTEVGYYSQADKIVTLALTVISSLVTVLLPRISSLYAEQKNGELEGLLNKALDYIFLLSLPMMIGCLLVIDEFVPVFFGDGYAPVTRVIQVLSVLYIVLSLGRLFGTLLVAENKQNKYTFAVTFASIVNFSLNLTFLQFTSLGAVGVSIASVLAETTATLLQLYYVKDTISIKMLVRSLRKYVIPTIIMGIALIGMRLFMESSFLSLIIQVGLGISLYFLMLILKKDIIVYSILEQIARKIHLKK